MMSYNENRVKGKINMNDSPMFKILNVAERFKIFDTCMNMALNGYFYPKEKWSKIVCEIHVVWALEDEEYVSYKNQLAKEKLLFQIIEKPNYLTWLVISDRSREHSDQCEIMARIVCDASLLKTSDVRRKRACLASRSCDKCDLGIEEDAIHMIMQCPFFEDSRQLMLNELSIILGTYKLTICSINLVRSSCS